MNKAFIYTRKTVKIDSLKQHPFFQSVGSFIPTDKFMEDFEYFGYIETPVVTADGLILTHTEDVIAATLMGDEEIEVVVIENASPEDLTRFIDFRSTVKHGKNRRIMYQTIDFLKEFLTKDKNGKEFAKLLEGGKTKEKIAKLLGVSPTTIQNITQIGNNDPKILDGIDNGETTAKDALAEITKRKENNEDGPEEIEEPVLDTDNEEPTIDNSIPVIKKEPSSANQQENSITELPKGEIVMMMVVYTDGSEITIEKKDDGYVMENGKAVHAMQYSSKEVRSDLSGNRNMEIEHDFMPVNGEKFHIGFTTRAQAA